MGKRKAKPTPMKTPRIEETREDSEEAVFYHKRTWTIINETLRAAHAQCLSETESGKVDIGQTQETITRVNWYSQELASALDNNDSYRAAYWALRFSSLTSSILGTKSTEALFEKRKKESGLARHMSERKRKQKVNAEIARDRVALLVRRGKGSTEAMKMAANDLGVSLRQVQRYCKSM